VALTAETRASAVVARARVTDEITQAHARVRSDAQVRRQGIHAWHTTASARLTDGVRTRQDRTRQLGDTHAGNLATAAGTAARRAQTEVGAKAQQARDIGRSKAGATGPTAEATDAKRKAANDISNDSASKITGGLGDTVSDIHQTGRDAGMKFKQDASTAATQLGSATPQGVAHLNMQREQAIQQIAQTEAQAAQAIRTSRAGPRRIRTSRAGPWKNRRSHPARSRTRTTRLRAAASHFRTRVTPSSTRRSSRSIRWTPTTRGTVASIAPSNRLAMTSRTRQGGKRRPRCGVSAQGPAGEHAGNEGEKHRVWSALRSACPDQRSLG
jgi:hypothetical protein